MERLTTGLNVYPAAPAAVYQPYNLTSSIVMPHPLVGIVKLENSQPPTIPLHPTLPASGRNGVVKYCGVCGDLAKSYHFGGLSCDSCKAFFRRSVQNDNYLHFQCCHHGQCVITLSNRKSCQYCRMKLCFGIGMEKSWVMTEEERKALMKARAEKKLRKQLAASASTTTTGGKSIFDFSSEDLGSSSSSSSYEPQIERMIDFLAPVEIKEIESFVTKYLHAYQHVPYRADLRFFDNDRPGVQVMEMFGTLIRRFAFYCRLMADFSSLPFQDQSCLLKNGVLEMCVLRGALVYDPLKNRWPNANMSMYKDAPFLKLDNIGHLTSNRIFSMHMEFINCIQQMGVDEPTIMLLILIVLFTPEREGLIRATWVEKFQAYYTSLLERYMSWRFGPTRSKFMFGKLLTKLSDLRELSETHNRHNLQLGNDEVSTIQNQLQHLNINPYPECKVVPEQPSVPILEESARIPKIPVNKSTHHDGYASSDTTQSVRSASTAEQSASGGSYLPPQPVPPTHQQHLQHPYVPYPNGEMNHNHNISYAHREPPSTSSSSYSSSNGSNSNGVGGTKGYNGLKGQDLQEQPQTANMALQFMQAMQQSVDQVINTPYFGFEFVKPDYQFEPIADEDFPVSSTMTPIQPVANLLSPESKSSVSQDSESDRSLGQPVVESTDAATQSTALTPRTMEALFEALEEYSELYN